MVDNVLYSNVATEILEICNYLDKEIFLQIPKKIIENLNKIKNENHSFKIDKSKSFEGQNMLKETRDIISILFLKYCCTKEEANAIIKENNETLIVEETEKEDKYSTDNIFKRKDQYETKQDIIQLIPTEEEPFYLKIIEKIKNLFNKILGKKES